MPPKRQARRITGGRFPCGRNDHVFQINGAMIYVNPDGKTKGYEMSSPESINAARTMLRTVSAVATWISSFGKNIELNRLAIA
jgi:hypothetical protein